MLSKHIVFKDKYMKYKLENYKKVLTKILYFKTVNKCLII